MGSGFRDTGQLSKLPYLDMKLGHSPKFQKLHIYMYCLSTRGVEIELIFALLRQRFLRYGLILKIAIFGQETWQVAKVPEVAQNSLFLPQGVEIELIFALWAAVSKIWANFQNCHIRA